MNNKYFDGFLTVENNGANDSFLAYDRNFLNITPCEADFLIKRLNQDQKYGYFLLDLIIKKYNSMSA